MKNLHIIPYEKFTEGYIRVINNEFKDIVNHFYVIISDESQKEKIKYDNVTFLKRTSALYSTIVDNIFNYDKIFVHNLSCIYPKLMLRMALIPKRKIKQYWILWGMDLYCYQEPKNTIKEKIFEFIRGMYIRHLRGIIFWVKGDYELAKKWYHTKAKYFRGGYSTSYYSKETPPVDTPSDGFVRIQVGNSAAVRNRHIEALEKISRIDNERLLLYCPLSYAGNAEYIQQVVSVGKELFGDRFNPITEMMPYENYVKYLETIDIGVFNTDRQMGLGNISKMLLMGKKVYVNDYTTSWDYYRSLGAEIFSFNNVNLETAEGQRDFLSLLDHKSKLHNYESIMSARKQYLSLWDTIFND